MINTSLADGGPRSCWEMGTPLPSADTGGRMLHREFRRPLPLLSVLLGVREGLVHCRLSALLAHHRRQPGSTPRRTASELVTPVSDGAARGPSGCIAVECGRRRGVVPRCTVAVAALSPSRSASRLCSTPSAMGECWLCSACSRACAVAPNAGGAITCEVTALG
ncbi:hypothetical protein TcG_12164 [Trypanosoma cruzi]|nr:hypothetical protein TcG_12164 [Trypanosoma cruzi]